MITLAVMDIEKQKNKRRNNLAVPWRGADSGRRGSGIALQEAWQRTTAELEMRPHMRLQLP